jgi:hypothetical protein
LNIKNKFLDLEFLKLETIKESKEILKNTFLIDFDNLENLFNENYLNESNLYENEKFIEELESKTRDDNYSSKKKKIKTDKCWSEKYVTNKLNNISLNQDINNIILELHKISNGILGRYNISAREYFQDIDMQSAFHIDNEISNYILDNIKNNICLFHDYKESNESEKVYKEELARIDALKRYIDTISVKEKEKLYKNLVEEPDIQDESLSEERSEEDIQENKNRNFSRNLKYLNNNVDRWIDIQGIFIDEEKQRLHKDNCYQISSNVYIYLLENYRQFRFLLKLDEYFKVINKIENIDGKIKDLEEQLKNENNNELEMEKQLKNLLETKKKLKKPYNKMKNILKEHKCQNILKYIDGFVKHKINFMDLYYFERINNNHFVLELYFNIRRNIYQLDEQISMQQYLYPIIYLPNVFKNSNIIMRLVNIYNNSDYYKNKAKFEEGVRKMCLDLSFFVIPLYNMIFSNLLKCYCDIKDKENIDGIIKRCAKKNKKIIIQEYKSKYTAFYRKDLLKIGNEEEFQLMSASLNRKLNFNMFNQNNFIKSIGAFNESIVTELINPIKKDKYQKNIKKFILENIDINSL